MKDGLFCFWDEGKSWADDNTNSCVVESTTACPANPSNGSYAFSCNINDCVLSCDSGYTKCGTSCVLNDPLPPNCTSYNQCTDTCTSCTAGYTVVGGVCEGVSLKLANDSVASGGNIIQSTNPIFYINPTGNIGISTSTPQSKLHVIGGVKMSNLDGSYRVPVADTELVPLKYVNENFASVVGGTGTAFLQGGNSFGSIATLGTKDAYNLDFITSSTTRMTIDSSGNVGIGTTSPGADLHINETLKLGDTFGANNTHNVQIDGSILIGNTFDYDSNYPTRTDFVIGNMSGNSRFLFGQSNGAYGGLEWYNNATASNALLSFYTNGQDMVFKPSNTEIMRMTTGGNVGIATTTPQAKLHVIGAAKMSNLDGSYRVPVDDTELVPRKYVDDNFAPITGGSGSAFLQGGNSFGTTAVLGTNDAYNLDLITSSTTRMTIDTSGNVGIGTESPDKPFVISQSADSEAFKIYGYDDKSSDYGEFYIDREGFFNINAKSRTQYRVNGQLTMQFFNTGNGTIAASWDDEYIGYGGVGQYRAKYDSGTGKLKFEDSNNNELYTINDQGTKADFNFNTGDVFFKNDGNVGIATTTPQSKLHVIGAAKMSNLDGSYRVPVGDTELVPLKYVNDNFASIIGGGSATFVGLTTSTYNGNQGGYESVNTLCSTEYADSHVCSTQEIYNTINLGLMSSFPAGPVSFWLNSGPPGYTANVNDCAGWKSSTADDYGAVWVISGTIFSSGIDKCLETRSFACCASS
jgi:hypothetical protein